MASDAQATISRQQASGYFATAGAPLVARLGVRGAVYGMLLSGGSYTAALAMGLIVTFRRELRLHQEGLDLGER